MASARTVVSTAVFIRDARVRHGGSPQRSRTAPGTWGKRCAAATDAFSYTRIPPQIEEEESDRVGRAVSDHAHPEIAAGGKVQQAEHETAQPCADHARQPLIC